MWTDNMEVIVISTFDVVGQLRWPDVEKELGRQQIPSFTRYEATINIQDAALGLLRTMKGVFEESEFKTILVFEDDVKFIRDDFNEIMEKVVKQLPEDYDLLYLGCNLLSPPARFCDNLFKIKSAYSSHAVMYSPKAIDLILRLWSEDKPYDNFLMTKIQPYGSCYCVNPLLATQRIGISSIFKYKPDTQIGIERYYNTKTEEMDWGLMMEERFKEFTQNL